MKNRLNFQYFILRIAGSFIHFISSKHIQLQYSALLIHWNGFFYISFHLSVLNIFAVNFVIRFVSLYRKKKHSSILLFAFYALFACPLSLRQKSVSISSSHLLSDFQMNDIYFSFVICFCSIRFVFFCVSSSTWCGWFNLDLTISSFILFECILCVENVVVAVAASSAKPIIK